MRRYLYGSLLILGLTIGGCGSTFVVSKDGKGYYFGSDSQAALELFCGKGDLKKILSAVNLAESMKEDLYEANCGPGRSGQKVRELYASLTAPQRKELRTSFKENGYDINYIPC